MDITSLFDFMDITIRIMDITKSAHLWMSLIRIMDIHNWN